MSAETLRLIELADYVLAIITKMARDRRGDGVLVAAVGGYPYVGKTTLANEVSAKWRGSSFVLPTESVIKSRSDRMAAGIDGSSVDSHDMAALVVAVNAIRGGGHVSLPKYSWLTGDYCGYSENPILQQDGLLLVDGSVATTLGILSLADVAFALCPARPGSWLEKATARDVAERSWNAKVALEQNRSKARTVDKQLASFGRNDKEYLLKVAL